MTITHKVRSKKGIFILTTIILVSGIIAISGRILSIAIPEIQKDFRAEIVEIQWVFNLNLIIIAVFTLISGAISDKYGIKKIFNLGILLFIIGCLSSAYSPSVQWLIYSQGISGLGVVLMGPGGLAIINSCFDPDEKSKATGIWVGIGAFFGVAGLLFGGFLVELWGWQWPFLLIAGLGIITLIVSTVHIPKMPANETISLAPLQSICLSVGLLGISYFLIYAQKLEATSVAFWLSLSGGFLGLASFIYLQITSKTPIIPRDMLKEKELVWSNFITFFLYMTLNGLYIYAIINFQDQYNFPPSEAGMALLPPSLIVALFASPLGKYADQFGTKWFIFSGSLLLSIGFFGLFLASTQASYWTVFFPSLVLIGFGMVLFVVPITKGAMSNNTAYAGSASGLNNTVARISGLMAVAVFGLIWAYSYEQHVLAHSENVMGLEQIATFGIYELSETLEEADATVLNGLSKSALNAGFKIIMLISVGLGLLSSVLSLFFLKSSKSEN